MPVTQIDDKAALVVIDLQVATMGMPTVPISTSEVLKHSVALADGFRNRGLPVIWVNVAGGQPGRKANSDGGGGGLPDNWTDLPEELGVQASDLAFTKYAMGAFHDDRFDDLLKSQGVTQLVVTGITTSLGVEGTARAAYDKGYNVVVVIDAVTDMVESAHDNSLNTILPNVAEVATTDEVVAALG